MASARFVRGLCSNRPSLDRKQARQGFTDAVFTNCEYEVSSVPCWAIVSTGSPANVEPAEVNVISEETGIPMPIVCLPKYASRSENPDSPPLTARETEVLCLMADGYSSKAIAA